VLALVLLVEVVDATVWTAEASVGVRHLLHAGDLAEQLAPRGLDRDEAATSALANSAFSWKSVYRSLHKCAARPFG
jgi:hypothetical protein